jgi:hypothetical protein
LYTDREAIAQLEQIYLCNQSTEAKNRNRTMSFARATSNAFLYANARQGDILMHTGGTPARVLFGTSGDTYAAITIDSNLTTMTDALALSNAAGQVTLSCAPGAPGAGPLLSVSGGVECPTLVSGTVAVSNLVVLGTITSNSNHQQHQPQTSNLVVAGNATLCNNLLLLGALARPEATLLQERRHVRCSACNVFFTALAHRAENWALASLSTGTAAGTPYKLRVYDLVGRNVVPGTEVALSNGSVTSTTVLGLAGCGREFELQCASLQPGGGTVTIERASLAYSL